jgi:hypothetical protein
MALTQSAQKQKFKLTCYSQKHYHLAVTAKQNSKTSTVPVS